MNTRNLIRERYKSFTQTLEKSKTRRVDPYIVDWIKYFTPIEYNVWQEIRFMGLPFYPQFPIDRFFVDFGDPIKKIAIEVDGKDWHTDWKKDEEREDFIKSKGWNIYRISGANSYRKELTDMLYFIKKHVYDNMNDERAEWVVYQF